MKDRNGKKVSNHWIFPEIKQLFEEKIVGYLNRLYRSLCVSLVFIGFFMQKGFVSLLSLSVKLYSYCSWPNRTLVSSKNANLLFSQINWLIILLAF